MLVPSCWVMRTWTGAAAGKIGGLRRAALLYYYSTRSISKVAQLCRVLRVLLVVEREQTTVTCTCTYHKRAFTPHLATKRREASNLLQAAFLIAVPMIYYPLFTSTDVMITWFTFDHSQYIVPLLLLLSGKDEGANGYSY